MKVIQSLFIIGALLFLNIEVAQAWHAEGCVYCDVDQNNVISSEDTPLEGVVINVYSTTFSGMRTTCTDGCYSINLPDTPDSYLEELDESTLPDSPTFIDPGTNPISFSLDDTQRVNIQDWLIDSYTCRGQQCWLTAGGVKFSTVTGTLVDEYKSHGSVHSWGGNVNPACAPAKGHWNHIAHNAKLHFQATDIVVLQCGNVPGIEPGSESPVTPVNFIEFTGPATLKGIKGNKDDFGSVCYFARAEDRNEPGSHGAKDGVDIDRYFLHVYDCDEPANTLLLVDMDGDPETVDPVTITGGNMQMHWNPCEK